MTFLIAAAGTGGHVFPGLAVGEALVDRGVVRSDVLYVGGNRLEATVCPAEGFPFLEVDIRGLRRSLTPSNLGLPVVVRRASKAISGAIDDRQIRAVLGLGGYVTIPTGMAARRSRVPLFLAEQNANIEEVHHQRAFTSLAVQNAEIELVLKTRNREHVDQIVEALHHAGFQARALGSE